MEYLLSRNYGNFIVSEGRCDGYISIMLSSDTFKNVKYGGVMSMRRTSLNDGTYTFLRKNGAYRNSFMNDWVYTIDEETILVMMAD